MEYLNKFNYKETSIFTLLMILPNLLGLINLTTPFGFKIHLFQFAIFLAAFRYGSIGGLAAGVVGSIVSALAMSNHYILLFNAILGFFAGFFYKKMNKAIIAVLIAYAIELPFLISIDIFIVNLPLAMVTPLLISLLVSNIIFSFLASKVRW